MKSKKYNAILSAVLAALAYSINIPLSKILIENAGPSMTAGLLYLGAGIMTALIMPLRKEEEKKRNKLKAKDFPYIALMIILDIAAPILLMNGLKTSSASLSALINNFEIAATAIIAALFFKEKLSPLSWLSILLITLSTIILSLSGEGGWTLSSGLILVLLATISWGLENNCTERLSGGDTYLIVLIKGIFSGSGAILIALLRGESFPQLKQIVLTLLLGALSYGVSIFLYIRAQRTIGAARTSAFYAVNPFFGALLSFLLFKENLTPRYAFSALIMAAGTALMVRDTLRKAKE